jgi:hypothetical protein
MVKIDFKACAVTGVVTFLTAVTGCSTNFDAVRVRPGVDIPPAGAPYNLTFTQYDVTVTRRVAGCQTPDKKAALLIAMDAEIVPKETSDPTRHYVIDLDSLQAAWKITDIEVTYHDNGALKSINSSAEDRTGPILVSAATSASKLVTALAAAGGAAPSGCLPATEQTLADIKISEGAVKAKTDRLERLTNDLKEMTEIASTIGKAWGKSELRLFANQIKAVQVAKADQVAEQKTLEGLLAKVSNVTKFTWPPDGATFGPKFDSPPTGTTDSKPMAASLVPDIDPQIIRDWGSPRKVNETIIDTRVFAKISKTSPIGSTDPCSENCVEDSIPGLKYRVPASGSLMICSTATCEQGTVIVQKDGPISQLGHVFTLPLRSGIFTNKTLVAEFTNAGQPTKIGVKETAASAETAATTLGSITDSFLVARSKVVPSKLDRIKNETELLKAQAELAAARKDLQPPANADQAAATEAFKADTALLQANLANIEARNALDAAVQSIAH